MNGVGLKRFTSFDFGVGLGYLEVWVNPAQIAYVQPRLRYDSKTDKHSLDGTRLYFQQEAGVLAVKEPIGQVVALLNSSGGVCRSCHQELPEAWRTLCADCRRATDAYRAELAADARAADEAYRDMLAHPETVVDAPELLS